jgi:hypothetical protein
VEEQCLPVFHTGALAAGVDLNVLLTQSVSACKPFSEMNLLPGQALLSLLHVLASGLTRLCLLSRVLVLACGLTPLCLLSWVLVLACRLTTVASS